jgi:hypothetical protein
MNEIHAIVVEHGDKSYIKVVRTNGYYVDQKHIAANGISGLLQAPGDSSFLMFDGKVTTLQKIIPARRITTKYELREDLRGSPKAETISVSDHGNLSEADQSLYRPVYEDIPQGAEDIPFAIQREDGPPSLLPHGVSCIDQNSFARFPSFHHLGPVRASAKYVLWRLAEAFQQIIADNPYITNSMHGVGRDADAAYKGIVRGYQDSFFIEVKPMTVNGIEVAPKGMKTMFTVDGKDRHLSYGRTVPALAGDNLDDLEKKIAAFIDKTTAEHRKWVQPNACPCCQRRFAKREPRP